ncbi:hypothetical protein MTO96_041830 [Rhipicephalus appendiculatus]
MYPPEAICQYLYYTDVVIVDGKIRASLERNSWKLFQMMARTSKKTKFGIAFDHWHITPQLVRDATGDLGSLATQNIGSYGLLNIIRKPSELNKVVLAMKPVIEELKTMQGSDADKRTVIAIGSYDYTGFIGKYKDIFAIVLNTFKVDAVIAISSVSSMEDKASCYAAPPNVVSSPQPRFPSLETHWPLVSAKAKYANVEKLRGLSFEMGTLLYVLEKDAASLNDSAYAKCLDFGMTTRDVLCGMRAFVNRKKYLSRPYMIYATFVREEKTSRRVAFSEFAVSPRNKYDATRQKYGSLHHRGVLMLFNVHMVDVRKRCGADPFSLFKWICEDFRGRKKCG